VPAREIKPAAETADADVLVIDAPHHWTSATEAVLASAMCPVLVTHDIHPLPYPKDDGTLCNPRP
jgi:hypothetical protein